MERDGQVVKIPVKEIVTGDRVIVYPGDQIPVDGYILHGSRLIDQCKLTGESVPVNRSQGDEVYASTLLVDGHLCILTLATGNNTRAGVIMSLMQSAPVHDTRVENYAAMVAKQAMEIIWQNTAFVAVPNIGALRCGDFLCLRPRPGNHHQQRFSHRSGTEWFTPAFGS